MNKVNEWLKTEAKRLRAEAASLERKDAKYYAIVIRLNRTYAERMEAEAEELV